MKLSDINRIPDPYTRFIQSMKFLRSLQSTEVKAAEIRDRALAEIRDTDNYTEGEKPPSLRYLGKRVGASAQRIHALEKRSKERYANE